MDKISIVAIIGGLTAIIAGQAMEGGNVGSLVQLTAFMIVMGGTMSAVMLQSTPKQFMTGVRMLRWVFVPPPFNHESMIREIISWSQSARRGGLLSLEGFVNAQRDPFTRKALQMLVDGAEPDTLRSVMEVEISMEQVAQMSEETSSTVNTLADTSRQMTTLSQQLQTVAQKFTLA